MPLSFSLLHQVPDDTTHLYTYISYPLVQTVNALYLQLLEMHKAFTSTGTTSGTLPASDEIKELQTEYTNMLTAIIDLLDGAKYLWEGESHEQ